MICSCLCACTLSHGCLLAHDECFQDTTTTVSPQSSPSPQIQVSLVNLYPSPPPLAVPKQIFSIVRWVFVPALVAAHHYTTVFNDVVVFLVMAVFAFSNGYTCSLAMMFAPAKVHPHERETAGLLLTLCLQLGIFGGSVFALALQAVFE